MLRQCLLILILGVATRAPATASEGGTAVITVGKALLDSSGRATIDLLLTPGEWPIASFQCDIYYQGQAAPVSESPGSAALTAGKTLWATTPVTGARRILIAGRNSTPISAGIIATVSFQMPAGTSSLVSPLGIMNAVASDPTGYFVPVQVTNTNGTPVVLAVVNAGSYAAGPISPGEMVVIWGSSLGAPAVTPLQVGSDGQIATSLSGTSVLFDGEPAPLVYSSQNQTSAMVPYGVDGNSETSIQVEYEGIRSAPFIAGVVKSSPGLFTLNTSGQGQGAILNQDGAVNGPANPASRGSVVSVFGTGGGQTVPACGLGRMADPVDTRSVQLPVTASIGDQDAKVLYAGSAGGQVCGLLQVNLRVPPSAPVSGAVPVAITIGSSSQSGVMIAVQ
jgi:uncharacterized protein (TIGR03437 family)